MVIFYKNNTPASWSGKINFVDNNNRLVGYDMESQCCEDFGWRITKAAEWDGEAASGSSDLSEEEMEAYSFVDEAPMRDALTSLYTEDLMFARFRLTDGSNEAFLWVWNSHNGYYSHGFDYDLGDNKDGGWL